MKKLANKIQEIRKINHMSQEELARSLGYANKTMINHIEAGDRGMSYEKLILLIKKYQLSLEDIIDKENDLSKQEKEYLANLPDKDSAFPNPNLPYLCYVKNTIKNKEHIIIGDYTYYYDEKDKRPFEEHVTHLYKFSQDKLIIGKFCSIGHGVEFIMNAANHKMSSISTYPFYIMGGKWGSAIAPKMNELPYKGDTIIGNDVWIGQNVTFLPGVKVGDGVIIGANSVVSKDLPPYSIAAGNPIRIIRKRFDDEMIKLLEQLKWWDKPIEEIDALIPLLSDSNLSKVKKEIKKLIKK